MRGLAKSLIHIFVFFQCFICICFFFTSHVRDGRTRIIDVQNNTIDNSTIIFKTIKHGTDFCVAYNITKSSGEFRQDGLEPITLVIHSTSNYLRHIESQCSVRNWNGPISVSLFIDIFSKDAVQYIHEVHRCSAKVNQKLNVHIVYRLGPFQQNCDPLIIEKSTRKCVEFNSTIRSRERGKLIDSFQIYPINVMRNVARIGAPSSIHMVADVEMVFSEGFALKAKGIANRLINGRDRNLLTIRRFEVDNRVNIPNNHQQLYTMIKSSRAFEFHHKFFPAGHTIDSLWHWFRLSKNSTNAYAWPIKYKGTSWEAQIILHRNDPYNREFIPTRIRDQQSLIYELCRANYTFHLASNVFNVHRGIKMAETNLSSAVLSHQRRFRARAYRKFMRIINERYPDTYQQCGKYVM